MIARTRAAGVPFAWVAGDEVHGGNPSRQRRLVSPAPIPLTDTRGGPTIDAS
jgi:hypothetical protein